jgi:hypothetical protein
MSKTIAARWQAWRDPQAQQARKAARRRARDQAFSEAESQQRRNGPPAAEVHKRGLDSGHQHDRGVPRH